VTIIPTRAVFRRAALALALASASALPAAAQDLSAIQTPNASAPSTAAPDLGLPKGALVFHGNYCGPGSRGNNPPPVDALDRACMHHDACSPPVGEGLAPCSCNQRLYSEAMAVARNPRTSDDLRTVADFVAEGAKALACR